MDEHLDVGQFYRRRRQSLLVTLLEKGGRNYQPVLRNRCGVLRAVFTKRYKGSKCKRRVIGENVRGYVVD